MISSMWLGRDRASTSRLNSLGRGTVLGQLIEVAIDPGGTRLMDAAISKDWAAESFLKIAPTEDVNQSWPEALRKCEGEGLSSLARVQRDAIVDELALAQQWCSQVTSLVSDMVSETTSSDADDIALIESALIEVDRGHEQVSLAVEAVASIYSESERRTIMSLHQQKRIVQEFATMVEIGAERSALHSHIFHYFDKQRRDARRLCGRIPSLLHHTGQLLHVSCHRIYNLQRCSLLDRMSSLGLDVWALGPGALYTPIRSKFALNPNDSHPDLVLSNSSYTVTLSQKPSDSGRWATVRSTNPVSPSPRHPNHGARLLIASTLATLRDPFKVLPPSQLIDMLWLCFRTVHGSDGAHQELAVRAPGSATPLRSRRRSPQRRMSLDQDTPIDNLLVSRSDTNSSVRDVLMDPMVEGSGHVLQLTLQLMGYHHPTSDQPGLHQISSPLHLRSRALHLIQALEQRCQTHARFQFEASCTGVHCDWMVGVTTAIITRPEYLGQDSFSMGIGADGRVYFNRQSMMFSSGFRPGQIVGVVVDMFNASVTVFRDGIELGIAFGFGSRAFPAAVVDAQIQVLGGEPLFPAISIRGSLPFTSGKGRSEERSKQAPPQVSVNLGQLPFSFPVPATTPVDKCRIFALEADTMSVVDDEFIMSPVLTASVRNIIIKSDESVGDGPLPTESEFVTNIECEAPQSFSVFPPPDARIVQAAVIVQRAVRAFLIRIRQAFFQRDVVRARKLKKNAALFLQRRWRGNRARIITTILIRKRVRLSRFQLYTIHIQRWWRRVVLTPAFQKRREEWLRSPLSRRSPDWAFIFGKLGGNRSERLKMLHQEALKVQKLWRGRRARVAFFNQNPIDAIRLSNLGFALRSRLETLRLILIAKPYVLGWVQRARYRLRRSRLQKALRIVNRSLHAYMVRSRLDEMMDATLSEPLKKFVYLLGRDSRLFEIEPKPKAA